MPPPPPDPAAGYHAATTAAAVFDTSAAGKLLLTGPDAPRLVHNISTNDVKDLPLGGGCETYFCDHKAKTLFAAWVSHVRVAGEHALWLETTPGRAEALLKHLDKYLIAEAVELADVTGRYAQFHVAGPTAAAVLAAATGAEGPALAEFQHCERTIGPAAVSVRRRDLLGGPGYDIVCPAESAQGVWAALTAAGAVPAGPEAFETLRVEAGTPVYGVDIDENRFVMEVGRAARAVSYAKGCFPGQEPIVMARDRAGRVNRSFVGLRVAGTDPLPPGTKLARDGQDAGVVTSSVASPRLGGPIALGYVGWKHAAAGTDLTAADGRAVTVLGYPPVGGG